MKQTANSNGYANHTHRDLIRHMLIVEPAERWSCSQLLQHQWYEPCGFLTNICSFIEIFGSAGNLTRFKDPDDELSGHVINKTVDELRKYQVYARAGRRAPVSPHIPCPNGSAATI